VKGVRRKSTTVVAALILGFFLSPFTIHQSPVEAAGQHRDAGQRWERIQRVVDGDSVVLQSGGQVRYIGIDTPEMAHRIDGVQPYAREAKAFNKRLVQGKRVRLELDVEHRDKYKRLLAYVYLEDGTFVNAELVRLGFARILMIPPNVRHADLFLKYQREAREAGRGLWGKDRG